MIVMQICPSMPFPNASDYVFQLRRLSPYFRYFQLDFADGALVEEKTAPVQAVVDAILKSGEASIIGLTFDFHLMVKDYKPEIEKLEKFQGRLRIQNVFVHFSAIEDFGSGFPKSEKFDIGLVLNPEDEVDMVNKSIPVENMPIIQIMSVIPGAQGRPFIPNVLNKIDHLRQYNYRNKIYLDGAVNDATLPQIYARSNRPDVVCPGSFLTKCRDTELKKRFDYLLKFV